MIKVIELLIFFSVHPGDRTKLENKEIIFCEAGKNKQLLAQTLRKINLMEAFQMRQQPQGSSYA